jgi:hypothetical protein
MYKIIVHRNDGNKVITFAHSELESNRLKQLLSVSKFISHVSVENNNELNNYYFPTFGKTLTNVTIDELYSHCVRVKSFDVYQLLNRIPLVFKGCWIDYNTLQAIPE